MPTPADDNGQRQRSPRSTGEKLKHFADHVSYFKLVLLAAVGLLICGFAVRQYVGDVVTTSDLETTVTQPIQAVESRVSADSRRIDKLEIGEASVAKRLDRQDQRADTQSQQLYEIAVRVGARRVPGIVVDKDAGP